MPRCLAKLPCFADRQVPRVARAGSPDLRPLSDYRYHDNLVKYEKLSDKGISGDQVKPSPSFKLGRPCPPLPFAAAPRKPGQPGSIKLERVLVQFLEERVRRGTRRRSASVSTSARRAIRSAEPPRVVARRRRGSSPIHGHQLLARRQPEMGAHRLCRPAGAEQQLDYTVELGSAVRRNPAETPLKIEDGDDSLTVVTGPLKVAIDKKHFNLFRNVWREGRPVAASAPEGVCLVDEHGKRFATSVRPPDSVRIEEQGPCKVVVRVEGPYAATDGRATCVTSPG